ncbi:MAG TPA: tetratricopeptide repeat protein [Planctomycetota bacterium]
MRSAGRSVVLALAFPLVLVPLALPACGGAPQAPAVPELTLAGVETEVAEALGAARAAVMAAPDSPKAWSTLADLFFAHDFKPDAARCYARAGELDPASYLWPYRQGWSLLAEDPAAAAAAFERALVSIETYAPAHVVLARALARLGQNDEALAHYARAAELDPTSAEPHAGTGLVHLAMGDYAAARTALEAALARNPAHVEAHAALAQACLALGQDKKAQQHAERARTLPQTRREADAYANPNVPPLGARARTSHGRELERTGRVEDALAQYRAALASNPDYYLARRSLANLLLARGEREAALELLREGVLSNPSFERVRKDLERVEGGANSLERDED